MITTHALMHERNLRYYCDMQRSMRSQPKLTSSKKKLALRHQKTHFDMLRQGYVQIREWLELPMLLAPFTKY